MGQINRSGPKGSSTPNDCDEVINVAFKLKGASRWRWGYGLIGFSRGERYLFKIRDQLNTTIVDRDENKNIDSILIKDVHYNTKFYIQMTFGHEHPLNNLIVIGNVKTLNTFPSLEHDPSRADITKLRFQVKNIYCYGHFGNIVSNSTCIGFIRVPPFHTKRLIAMNRTNVADINKLINNGTDIKLLE